MAPIAAQRLLQRQGIDSASVTFTGHQASQRLLDIWQATLKPGAMFQTLAQFGNMTVANIPVNICAMQGTAELALGRGARLGRRHACPRPAA